MTMGVGRGALVSLNQSVRMLMLMLASQEFGL